MPEFARPYVLRSLLGSKPLIGNFIQFCLKEIGNLGIEEFGVIHEVFQSLYHVSTVTKLWMMIEMFSDEKQERETPAG